MAEAFKGLVGDVILLGLQVGCVFAAGWHLRII